MRGKWFLYCYFTILVALKTQIESPVLVLVIVIAPLLLCTASGAFFKVCESIGFYKSSTVDSYLESGENQDAGEFYELRPLVLRQLACAIDQCGIFFGGIFVCNSLQLYSHNSSDSQTPHDPNNSMNYSLVNDKYSNDLFIPLLPLWISIIASTLLRLGTLVMMGDRMKNSFVLNSSLRPSGYLFSLSNMIFQLVIRGVLPALVVRRLSGGIADWSIVFTPLWVLLFGGVALGVLLILRAPLIFMGDVSDLQQQVVRVVYMVAAHVIVVDMCVFISLIWLTERLESDESNNINSSTSSTSSTSNNYSYNYNNTTNDRYIFSSNDISTSSTSSNKISGDSGDNRNIMYTSYIKYGSSVDNITGNGTGPGTALNMGQTGRTIPVSTVLCPLILMFLVFMLMQSKLREHLQLYQVLLCLPVLTLYFMTNYCSFMCCRYYHTTFCII